MSTDDADEDKVILKKRGTVSSPESQKVESVEVQSGRVERLRSLLARHVWFLATIAVKITALVVYLCVIKLPLYVDEQIHVPQAQRFCNSNYDYDPKISTMPGLYYFARVLWKSCDLAALRLLNAALSLLNHWLLYEIKLERNDGDRRNAALWALSVTFSAPILFFDHLFYTETLSICLVLAMIWRQADAYTAAIIASVALFVRQDNIFWIGYVVLPHVYEFAAGVYRGRGPMSSASADQEPGRVFVKKLLPYAVPCCAFVAFVVRNEYSVALGDQSAHRPRVHLLQVAYAAEFVLGLSPAVVCNAGRLASLFRCRVRSAALFLLFAVITAAVRYDLPAHPYLLNDNRHFTFYLWNRIGQYQNSTLVVSIAAAVVHCTAVALVLVNSAGKRAVLGALFVCTAASVIVHELLDVRYFFVPFILFKLAFSETEAVLCGNLASNLVLNFATLYVLQAFEVRWPDIDYVQRVGW